MNTIKLTAAIGMAISGAVLLGGCASVINPLITKTGLPGIISSYTYKADGNDGPPAKTTLQYQGHAFRLVSVTAPPDTTPLPGTKWIPAFERCLPNNRYAQMLQYDLKKAFSNSGLTKGKLPTVPVSVVITRRFFGHNTLFSNTSSEFDAMVTVGKVKILTGMSSSPAGGVSNEGPDWTLQQRQVPAMTVKITRNLRSIQKGLAWGARPGHWGQIRSELAYVFQHGGMPGINIYHITYPMTQKEMEAATEQSAAQLNAVCQAYIKKSS